MAEINVRTLMFNLGPEDAIDSTTSAKIACYTERKQLAYKLTDEGVLLLDGRGKKIHLKNGVVTLRNALGLHALPERIMTNVMREDVSLQGQRCCAIDSIGDNQAATDAHRDATNDTDEHVECTQDGIGRSATAEIVARKHDAAATSR